MRADGNGGYRVEDGLYKAGFASGAYDVTYEVPKPVQLKFFRDPSKPAPPTKLNWKILSLGYFDQQSKRYQVVQNAKIVTPIVGGSKISYPQIFAGIDLNYTCDNVRVKEEFVLSHSARQNLPDPTQYNIPRGNAYLMIAMEFMLSPDNLQVWANTATGRVPIKTGNNFAFEGDARIDFEDEIANLHFFFPKEWL